MTGRGAHSEGKQRGVGEHGDIWCLRLCETWLYITGNAQNPTAAAGGVWTVQGQRDRETMQSEFLGDPGAALPARKSARFPKL